MPDYKDIVQQLLLQAAVKINGSAPWDIQVHNSDFYKRAVTQGTLGLGESYMDGWWSCEAIDQLFHRIIMAQLHKKLTIPFSKKVSVIVNQLLNMQTRNRSRKVVDEHYDSENVGYL